MHPENSHRWERGSVTFAGSQVDRRGVGGTVLWASSVHAGSIHHVICHRALGSRDQFDRIGLYSVTTISIKYIILYWTRFRVQHSLSDFRETLLPLFRAAGRNLVYGLVTLTSE